MQVLRRPKRLRLTLQVGGKLEYVIVSPSGEVSRTVLGLKLAAWDSMQFLCTGGYIKGVQPKEAVFWIGLI
jgi:predicted cupin superfamily sugar epimerase